MALKGGRLLGLILFGLVIYGVSQQGEHSTSEPAKPEKPEDKLCRDDWTKCKDNSQLVNVSHRWTNVTVACKIEAQNRAEYGSPSFPWIFPFSHYYPGDNYIKTGIATAIETNAEYQNQYGAAQHSKVICTFDLNCNEDLSTKCVRSIIVMPRSAAEGN